MLAVFIGRLTGNGNDEDARRLLAEAGATFPAGFTTDEFVIDEYDLEAMPTTSFYKGGGHYLKKLSGILLDSDLRKNAEEIQG